MMLFLVQTGSIKHVDIVDSLRRFGRAVLPHFTRQRAGGASGRGAPSVRAEYVRFVWRMTYGRNPSVVYGAPGSSDTCAPGPASHLSMMVAYTCRKSTLNFKFPLPSRSLSAGTVP